MMVLVISCGPATKQKRIQRTFELANAKLEQAYYDEAVSLYSQVIDKDPEIIDAFMNRGVAYFESGHYALALADYNHVYFNYPEYPEVIFNLVYCHMQLERFDQAKNDIKQLRNLYPDSALVDVIEGLFWTEQRELTKAQTHFSDAIVKDPQNFDAWTNRGIVNYHLGQYQDAKNYLEKALQISQNAPEALNPLSLVLIELNQLGEADSIVDLALKIQPNHPYLINNKGLVKIHQKKFDEADSLIQLSIQLDDQNAWAYKNLGLLAKENGEANQAISYLERSLNLDSTVLESYDELSELYDDEDSKMILNLKTNHLPK